MQNETLRTAVITGANRGLGLGLVEYVLEEQQQNTNNPHVEGWQILLTARDQEKCTATIEELLKKYPGSKISAFPLEITKSDSIDALAKHIESKFNNKIDLLVNNAGFANRDLNNIPDRRFTIETNFNGVINLTNKLWPTLTENAKVVVVSSTLGTQVNHSEYVKDTVNKPDIKFEDLNALAEEFLKDLEPVNGQLNEELWEQKWKKSPPYHLSKVLISTYVREILSRKVVGEQSAYALCPGWCRTGLGGQEAVRSIEEGVDTMYYVSFEVPFKRDPELHGKFIRDRKVQDW